MSRALKARTAESKARTEAEIRAVAEKLAHRPAAEVVQYLRESRGIAADPDFVQSLLGEGAKQ